MSPAAENSPLLYRGDSLFGDAAQPELRHYHSERPPPPPGPVAPTVVPEQQHLLLPNTTAVKVGEIRAVLYQ